MFQPVERERVDLDQEEGGVRPVDLLLGGDSEAHLNPLVFDQELSWLMENPFVQRMVADFDEAVRANQGLSP